MKEYLPICRIYDLHEGQGKKVRTSRTTIAVFKYDGNIYAVQNACPHQRADLADGYVRDGKLYCRLHHWAFDLSSGAYAFNPDMQLHTYRVIIKKGIIYLDLNQKNKNGK